MKKVNIIGAGLAGCEAAYQLVKRGIKVDLYEMKPAKKAEAFKSDYFAELVCSNSLRSDDPLNAVGLLKKEMEERDSLIIKAARINQIPAGTSLAVDREGFSKYITDFIKNHPLITVINKEVLEIDDNEFTIVTTGPLTSKGFSDFLKSYLNEDYFYFYDAIAPIVTKESIDFNYAYYKSRYSDGQDYINCPLTKEEYDHFYQELINARKIELKDFEKEIFFDGCMPFEEMAKRGYKTLLYGPMKPVGLEYNGIKPYAVIQLRKDNAIDSLYNIVGFQTHLSFGEQKRILSLVKALKNVEIVRYGVMHRNTYINSPKLLNEFYQLRKNPKIFFAGQISGVEGYVESAASGLYAGINMSRLILNKELIKLKDNTIIGSMAAYISNVAISKLNPMNANFGILNNPITGKKKERRQLYFNDSMKEIKEYIRKINE